MEREELFLPFNNRTNLSSSHSHIVDWSFNWASAVHEQMFIKQCMLKERIIYFYAMIDVIKLYYFYILSNIVFSDSMNNPYILIHLPHFYNVNWETLIILTSCHQRNLNCFLKCLNFFVHFILCLFNSCSHHISWCSAMVKLILKDKFKFINSKTIIVFNSIGSFQQSLTKSFNAGHLISFDHILCISSNVLSNTIFITLIKSSCIVKYKNIWKHCLTYEIKMLQ